MKKIFVALIAAVLFVLMATPIVFAAHPDAETLQVSTSLTALTPGAELNQTTAIAATTANLTGPEAGVATLSPATGVEFGGHANFRMITDYARYERVLVAKAPTRSTKWPMLNNANDYYSGPKKYLIAEAVPTSTTVLTAIVRI